MSSTPENKMGTMPVNRLLLSMSFPMMISMLVQAFYNIVDSFFVAQLGQAELNAVTLTFPLQNLMIAFATGTGVGINALLSKSLGEKNFERADKAASNGIFLAAAHYLIFLIIGVFFSGFFFRMQNPDPKTVAYGTTYAGICLGLSFGIFIQITMERLLLSTGKSIYSMITHMSGAIINIILDPIFIFGLKLGVAGAAIATVIGQIIAACVAVYFNIRFNNEIHIFSKKFRPEADIIKKIYSVGLPSIIMASITSVMTFGINKILGNFGDQVDDAQSVFGVYYKLQSFVFMPVFGLNNGMVPIISYNYGAKNPDRMTKTIRLSVTYAVAIMIAGLLVFHIFPDKLLALFEKTPGQFAVIGVPAFRAISLSFIFAGFCIIAGSVFQAVGNGLLSMIVSIVRQLLVLLPSAYLLSLSGNINLVWFSFPIAELASLTFSSIFLVRIHKNIISKL